ncbi:MAG: hypothetical protein U9R15_10165, partial [Chloroflexota bacterium]|nr:hypothetical protein [Chloroflexota bacterium]
EFSIRLCVHDNNCAQMYCSAASTSYIEQSWDATGSVHYIKVEKYGSALITQTTSYVLEVVEEYVPPATNTPTPTPTPTSTPLPSVTEKDAYEDNNNKDQAYELPVSTSVTLSSLEGLANFYPGKSDEDWFKFWAKNDKWYQVTTSNLNGVDTYVDIRDQNNSVIKGDDDGGGGLASRTSWEASYDGYYYVRIINQVNTSGTYDMNVEESDAPPADATATPGPGPSSEADSCEDNLDFDHACVIATDKSYNFNLHPPYGTVDNDYYKIWVKPGFIYKCATSNLDPGIDPNMIVYDHNQNGLGGNDDVEPGNFNSAFSYYASYDGWLYVLVGTGDRTPSDINNSNYTLLCNMQTPGQPTSTPGPDPTNTPSGEATSTPEPTDPPTSIPPEEITIRPMTTPTPAPAPGPDGTPAPRFIPINLLVYYDGNDDHQPGAGEGIAGISAQAYEAAANQLLAQGFTDEQGNLEFTVSAQGPVRVSIPFFGFSQLVTSGDKNEEGVSIYLRIPPQTLPGAAD